MTPLMFLITFVVMINVMVEVYTEQETTQVYHVMSDEVQVYQDHYYLCCFFQQPSKKMKHIHVCDCYGVLHR